MKIFEPLRFAPFRRLYATQVVANLGDGLDFLAIVTIVIYQWHRGPGAMGVLALCSAVPIVIGAPIAGQFADRFEPRLVLSATNLVRGGATAAIALSDEFWLICALSVVVAFAGGFYGASQQRFIRFQVPDDMLLSANSLRSTTERMLTGLAGPGLAGATIAVAGPRWTLAVTAVCFVVAGLAVVTVGKIERVPDQDEDGTSWGVRMMAGISYVKAQPMLRLAIGGVAAAYLFAIMFDVMLPVWYRDMGGGPAFMAMAMMCLGVGGVAGAVLLARAGNRYDLMSMVGGSVAVTGLLVALMGAAGSFRLDHLDVVWLALVTAIGALAAVALVGYGTLVQRLTPPGLMGRVGALSGSAVAAPTIAGPALAPGIAAALGLNGLFLVCGAMLLATGGSMAWRSRVRGGAAAAYVARDTPDATVESASTQGAKR